MKQERKRQDVSCLTLLPQGPGDFPYNHTRGPLVVPPRELDRWVRLYNDKFIDGVGSAGGRGNHL